MTKASNGDGTIRPRQTQKGVVYDVQVSIKDRNTGVSHRKTKGGFKTEKAAKAWRTQQMQKSNMGQAVGGRSPFVAEVVERYIDSATHLAPTTRQNYISMLRAHIRPKLEGIKAERISGSIVDEYLKTFQSEGTARLTRDIIMASLNWASRSDVGLLSTNPLRGIPPRWAGQEASRREALGPDDVRGLLGASKGQASYFMWRLLLATGARRGEINPLLWSDVDFKRGRINIDKISAPETNGKTVVPRTKGRQSRVVPISDPLKQELAAEKLRRGASSETPIFIGPTGAPVMIPAVGNWWRRDTARAGLEGFVPHSLRHTWATTALEAGVPVHVVSKILGHSSVAITLNIYAHSSEQQERLAVDAVQDAFASHVAEGQVVVAENIAEISGEAAESL